MIDGFLAPGALGAALLAVPILLTYMLKARRPRQVVSSTFLWLRQAENVTASRPWERLRPSVLLVLQLLGLAVLVAALARPFVTAAGISGDHLVVVVDASGSMLAVDGSPSRMESARLAAQELVDQTRPGAAVSVIAAGPQPRVLLSQSPDRAAAERAIRGLAPTHGHADFSEAFLLAESLQTPGLETAIALVSDGGLTPEEEKLVPPGALFRSVGRSSDNLGITRIAALEGPGGFSVLVAVTNFSEESRSVRLRLELAGVPVGGAQLRLGPSEVGERNFDVSGEVGRLVASIDSTDVLSADNRGYAVLERSLPRRILLVTPGNDFLEALLSRLPGATVDIERRPVPADSYDLVVYDRVAVPQTVSAPALLVAPDPAPRAVKVAGVIRHPLISYIAPEEPLLDQVDLSQLAVRRAQKARIPRSETLVGSGESPLIATWTEGSVRRAYVAFDLHDSNLPLQVAFPVLGDHLLSWLTSRERPEARVAGETLVPPHVAGATSVEASLPDGTGASLAVGEALEETARTGFYELVFRHGDEVLERRTVALSVPPLESQIAPREVKVPRGGERSARSAKSSRPAWAWLLPLALALLALEWWWAHGRPTLTTLVGGKGILRLRLAKRTVGRAP